MLWVGVRFWGASFLGARTYLLDVLDNFRAHIKKREDACRRAERVGHG